MPPPGPAQTLALGAEGVRALLDAGADARAAGPAGATDPAACDAAAAACGPERGGAA